MTDPIELTTIHQYIAIAEMCPSRAAYVMYLSEGPKCLHDHEVLTPRDVCSSCRYLLFSRKCPLGYHVKAPDQEAKL